MKLSNLRRKHVKGTTWPKEKKLQAVAQYLALGNMKLVSATTGVDHGVLRQWKIQPWWKEMEIEIRATENIQLDSNLSKIVDKSLEAVQDRLENGDFIYDQKTGQIKRKPVNMKDAAKVSVDLLAKRELLRGNATARNTTQISTDEMLKTLAQGFARMAQGLPPQEVIDVEVKITSDDVELALEDSEDIWIEEGSDDAVHEEREEGLQAGSGELYEPTECGEEEDGAECSPSGNDEGGEGPQG